MSKYKITKKRVFKYLLFINLLIIQVSIVFANEAKVNKYFESIKNNQQKLLVFLTEMPKGGDLHNHLIGAATAEDLISYASKDERYIDPKSYEIVSADRCVNCVKINEFIRIPENYQHLIKTWSMQDFTGNVKAAHDHFFDAFIKFLPLYLPHSGEMLAKEIQKAAQQNISYLELLVTPDLFESSKLGYQITWNNNFTDATAQLQKIGLQDNINAIGEKITDDEKIARSILQCDKHPSKPACHVVVRYIYQVLRNQQPANLFSQLLVGFQLYNYDNRFVGINLVQPEDDPITLQNYQQQMQMVAFLHKKFPSVNISLHAGELVPALVDTKHLTFHIFEAVNIAEANRIGHGVDILYEKNNAALLQLMKNKKILVEINLSSNSAILGVNKTNHPILMYLSKQVPIALSTDDAGLLRTNLTKEFMLATERYNFSYTQLKEFVKNSISYSFLPGKNLWNNQNKIVAVCAKDKFGASIITKKCNEFLNKNEKAKAQWDLENKFNVFENKYSELLQI